MYYNDNDDVGASDGEKRLRADLMTSYDKQVRPLHDPTHAVEVNIEFDLNHFKKIVRIYGRMQLV